MTMEPPDPLGELLMRSPGKNAGKSAAWDAFNSAKDEDELAAALDKIDLPRETKARLWDLKASDSAKPQGAPLVESTPKSRAEFGKLIGKYGPQVMPGGLGLAARWLDAGLQENPKEALTSEFGEEALTAASLVAGPATRAALATPAGQALKTGAVEGFKALPGVSKAGRVLTKMGQAYSKARAEGMAAQKLVVEKAAEADAAQAAMARVTSAGAPAATTTTTGGTVAAEAAPLTSAPSMTLRAVPKVAAEASNPSRALSIALDAAAKDPSPASKQAASEAMKRAVENWAKEGKSKETIIKILMRNDYHNQTRAQARNVVELILGGE